MTRYVPYLALLFILSTVSQASLYPPLFDSFEGDELIYQSPFLQLTSERSDRSQLKQSFNLRDTIPDLRHGNEVDPPKYVDQRDKLQVKLRAALSQQQDHREMYFYENPVLKRQIEQINEELNQLERNKYRENAIGKSEAEINLVSHCEMRVLLPKQPSPGKKPALKKK